MLIRSTFMLRVPRSDRTLMNTRSKPLPVHVVWPEAKIATGGVIFCLSEIFQIGLGHSCWRIRWTCFSTTWIYTLSGFSRLYDTISKIRARIPVRNHLLYTGHAVDGRASATREQQVVGQFPLAARASAHPSVGTPMLLGG